MKWKKKKKVCFNSHGSFNRENCILIRHHGIENIKKEGEYPKYVNLRLLSSKFYVERHLSFNSNPSDLFMFEN